MGSLDGSIVRKLTGQVIEVGTPILFRHQVSRFGELRALFTETGGTFALTYRWLEGEGDTDFLGETIVATSEDVDPVLGPWVEIRLVATVAQVTITRGSIYGARSPSA